MGQRFGVKLRWAALLCSAALIAPALGAEGTTLTGEVVGIADGDTLTILVDQVPHRIRLAMIDAPESGQAFGRVSRYNLSHHAFRKLAHAHCHPQEDRYGRKICEVHVGAVNLNEQQIRDGMAWVYREYVPPSSMEALVAQEAQAREARRGLWQGSQPIAPWEFRKQRRESAKREAPSKQP